MQINHTLNTNHSYTVFNYKNLISCLIAIWLVGCASRQAPVTSFPSNSSARQAQMQALTTWQLEGRIAFLSAKRRQSASIFWQKQTDQQSINLTTVMGINVLSVQSEREHHQITYDDQRYSGHDLSQLIFELTGLELPAPALASWLKGIGYSNNDHINYHPTTNLPQSLNARYYQRNWDIRYADYVEVNGHQLATKVTIKQGNLTIKLVIHQWTI